MTLSPPRADSVCYHCPAPIGNAPPQELGGGTRPTGLTETDAQLHGASQRFAGLIRAWPLVGVALVPARREPGLAAGLVEGCDLVGRPSHRRVVLEVEVGVVEQLEGHEGTRWPAGLTIGSASVEEIFVLAATFG